MHLSKENGEEMARCEPSKKETADLVGSLEGCSRKWSMKGLVRQRERIGGGRRGEGNEARKGK